MTNDELAAIERRLQAASTGPWEDGPQPANSVPESGVLGCVRIWCDGSRMGANTELVKHAPTDIAALIAEVRRLQDALNICHGENSPAYLEYLAYMAANR